MQLSDLTLYAKNFLHTEYNLKLEIPIIINNRFKTTQGCFIHTIKDGAISIELAGFLLKYASINAILDTLKHELIHYVMFTQNKPYCDGDLEFEQELIKHGIGATETNIIGVLTLYTCPKCQKKYSTDLESVYRHPEKYYSRCCHEKILITGERIYNGEENTYAV